MKVLNVIKSCIIVFVAAIEMIVITFLLRLLALLTRIFCGTSMSNKVMDITKQSINQIK